MVSSAGLGFVSMANNKKWGNVFGKASTGKNFFGKNL